MIITNLLGVMDRSEGRDGGWGFDTVRSVCGGMKVTRQRHQKSNKENWAGLVDIGQTTVAQFIAEMADPTLTPEEVGYVFDESLADHCPLLLWNFTVPSYFVQDIGFMVRLL